jgi:hypothetical protein
MIDIVEMVTGQGDLLEVIPATQAIGTFPHLLHGGHEQGDQNGDKGDHHQQFEQGQGTSVPEKVSSHEWSPLQGVSAKR